MAGDYNTYFRTLAALPSGDAGHAWQLAVAGEQTCVNRLIRVPTGFGKTLGVLGAWLWNRIEQQRTAWPRRLVWCLPMRVLVEQTEAEARAALGRLGLLWNGGERAGKVGVHLLMGGTGAGDWHLHPEHEAVLIGTQDMLLSRALNRGYASPRARWPMEFGLLGQDCLWVMDEVQLMDVGLATSVQLRSFGAVDESAGKLLRPCRTWWMSATLQSQWLDKSPEARALATSRAETRIVPTMRAGPLWEGVRKPCRQVAASDASALARLVTEAHTGSGRGRLGPTLVVLNTVRDAVSLYSLLAKTKELEGTDLRLAHSRFRGHERAAWRERFLNRAACVPGTDRIIVATQVIEAGVDISAAVLVTQLAPWASLVQRFGRAARWGGVAEVLVVDHLPRDGADADKLRAKQVRTALPYALDELEAALGALSLLTDVSPASLESFEETHAGLLRRLYPYAPRHLLLRQELEELFDTSSDLSGADIDVSRFIRSGEERDLSVFWSDVPKDAAPASDRLPGRDALCAVRFLDAREWLCGKETASSKAPRLARGRRAWVWDYLAGRWRIAERRDLFPGQTVLVAADTGGYDPAIGWAPDSRNTVEVVASAESAAEDRADASEDSEALSAIDAWQTIATHGAQVGREAAAAASGLDDRYRSLLDLAGRWHDAGKALPPFQSSVVGANRPARRDLAKAPSSCWLATKLYPDPPNPNRRGFRHELASTLALFDVLSRHQPDHPALIGPWRELLEASGHPVPPHVADPAAPPNPLEREILELAADDFDLLAYLVCAHHGKVRLAWHASPADQEATDAVLRLRGVRDGEELPSMTLVAAGGSYHTLPASRMRLDASAAGLNPVTGRGWTERVLGLLDRHGPFVLAYLEALLRAADQRASRAPIGDPLLESENADYGLETSRRELAPAEPGRAPSPSMAADSAQRGAEHGLRRGAGQPGDTGGGTRPPSSATRHVETARGILSYAELAPLLAERVAVVERAIESGDYDAYPLDEELIRQLHARMCGDLVPSFAGWRRKNVVIGAHEPPPYFRVPLAMREYARDLAARLEYLEEKLEQLPELLAFAEGRLLSIHPFSDFNGRATRLFLRLLLRQLELPPVDLVPPPEETTPYLQSLAACDRADWSLLAAIWRKRLAQEDNE